MTAYSPSAIRSTAASSLIDYRCSHSGAERWMNGRGGLPLPADRWARGGCAFTRNVASGDAPSPEPTLRAGRGARCRQALHRCPKVNSRKPSRGADFRHWHALARLLYPDRRPHTLSGGGPAAFLVAPPTPKAQRGGSPARAASFLPARHSGADPIHAAPAYPLGTHAGSGGF